MPDPEHTLDLTALSNAIDALRGALDVLADVGWLDRQRPPVKATLVAGTIQSFEFVYEPAVRLLGRRLELDAANPAEVRTLAFRDLLRTAADRGPIDDVRAWFAFRDLRNATAHSYDRGKADQVLVGLPDFLAAVGDLWLV